MQPKDAELKKILEEEDIEWWRPTKEDNYNLTRKLMRKGCRPTHRKYLNCINGEESDFKQCQVIKDELDKCVKMLQYLYATKTEDL